MQNGIDTAVRLTEDQCKSIRRGGYLWVGRYLVPPNSYRKALTLEEAKTITDAGLHILTVYETTANRAKSGWTGGIYDGEVALACAKNIGMPESAVIYFAVDYDAPSADFQTIENYLKAAKSVIYPYKVGVYGGYKVVDYLAGKKVCDAYWQCMAWSYGKKHPERAVYQAKADVKMLGISADINECESMEKAGIWNYKEADRLTERRYNFVDELPGWAKEVVLKYIRAGAIKGGGKAYDQYGYPADLDLSMDMIRTLIMVDNYTNREANHV